MINQLVGSGYVAVWLMLIVGFFVYVRADVKLVASGQNGVEMDTLISKTYGIFIVQLGVALSLVVYPIATLLMGKHWMGVAFGTFFTMFLGLEVMLGIKKVMEGTVKALETRREGERYRHDGSTVYKIYNILTWIWLGVGVGALIVLQVANKYKEYSIYGDLGIGLFFIAYILLLTIFVGEVQKTFIKEEETNRGQVDKIREEEKKGKKSEIGKV